MFEKLSLAPPDSILGVIEAFQKDPNPEKINLTVGIYQDAAGRTPILRTVKEAERRLLEKESNKGYLGIDGLPEFDVLVRDLVLGKDHPRVAAGCASSVQTPGGTCALRVAADFLHQRYSSCRMWCSTPTWANHPQIFQAAGIDVHSYPYLDASETGLDFDALLRQMHEIPAGDVVCLHGCCHNPTGVDLTPAQWRELARALHERHLLPLIDLAYQGFGDGLREDTAGVLEVLEHVDEALLCTSYSKNFGLYAERVGALTLAAATPEATAAALSHIKASVRANYSNPPKHGAAIVATVLGDLELRRAWEVELTEMRSRIQAMRTRFVEMMHARVPHRDFSFITRQRGMFSYSGLTPLQVDELKRRFAIYIVNSGRINVAGMTEQNLPRLCDSIAAVL